MGSVDMSTASMHMLTLPTSLLSLHLSECSLSTLTYLDLSNSTWLSKIQQLDLSDNGLEGRLPRVFLNMTSLTYLDLSSNNFNGSIPASMRNMRKLEYLNLGGNSFSDVEGGAIMGILGSLCKLKTFVFSDNDVTASIGAYHNFSKCVSYNLENLQLKGSLSGGTFPNWLGDFKNLRFLDVSSNSVCGPIPQSICSLAHLEELNLSDNSLTHTLPDRFGNLRTLRVLDISGNNISGQIPISIGNFSYLEMLDLSGNSLNGTIPEGLGRCKSLVYIDLSSNFLQGIVSESHLANLSRLEYLDLSFNPSLDLNFSSDWSPSFQLSEFRMRSCKIHSEFPQWIGDQTNLVVLDLSDNMITGNLVQLFSSNQLRDINISHNQVTGPVPYFSSSLLFSIELSYNLLSGPLQYEISYDTVGLPVSQLQGLEFLDLQRNKISGTIPNYWDSSNLLTYINLSSNNLSGNIPSTILQRPFLQILKLNNNSLQGPIPELSFSRSFLLLFDLGENKLAGNIPDNWGKDTYPFLKILRLRGNQLVGTIPTTLCYPWNSSI